MRILYFAGVTEGIKLQSVTDGHADAVACEGPRVGESMADMKVRIPGYALARALMYSKDYHWATWDGFGSFIDTALPNSGFDLQTNWRTMLNCRDKVLELFHGNGCTIDPSVVFNHRTALVMERANLFNEYCKFHALEFKDCYETLAEATFKAYPDLTPNAACLK